MLHQLGAFEFCQSRDLKVDRFNNVRDLWAPMLGVHQIGLPDCKPGWKLEQTYAASIWIGTFGSGLEKK